MIIYIVESTPVDVSQNYPSPSFQKLLTASWDW